MGGGVANLVAAELLHGNNDINNQTNNVYCYTFAAPNTFYSPDNKFEEQITLEKKYECEWREPKRNV